MEFCHSTEKGHVLVCTSEHHIEDVIQKVNDIQRLKVQRFLYLYYALISLKFLSHGLALLEFEPTVCSTVDVYTEESTGI